MINDSINSFLTMITLWILHIFASAVGGVASFYWGSRLHARGVEQYFFWRWGDENKEAYYTLVNLLEGAIDVKIAVGEMGHRLMENDELLEGLTRAYEENQANIEIVHGPRVDPRTTRIFDMAKEDIVSLFCMPVYRTHHFILITNADGETAIVEEGRHLETRWKKEKNNWVEGPRSLSRTYFVSDKNTKRSDTLRRVFRTRKIMSSRSYEAPDMEKNKQTQLTISNEGGWRQVIADWRQSIKESMWVFRLKAYYQQKSIILDSGDDIDLHEKWVSESAPKKTRLFTPEVPDRAVQMYESRIAPARLSELRAAVELSGPEVAIDINDFRRFHMMEFGTNSVGYLDCQNSVFRILIMESVDTLEELNDDLLKKYPEIADSIYPAATGGAPLAFSHPTFL